jgi:hypothetical protein
LRQEGGERLSALLAFSFSADKIPTPMDKFYGFPGVLGFISIETIT